ncbi:MAG: hypothetical protein ACXU71_08530 [Croceibacterium sp.]
MLGVAAVIAAALPPSPLSAAPVKTMHAAHPARKKAAPAKPEEPSPPPEVTASEPATRLLHWIATSGDNGSLPYIVIDKQAAELLLFDKQGKFLGQTPVLIGIGVGDESSPGVGTKKSLAEIGPAERTTPAGRFVARFGKAFGRERVLWVDYADSVALHAVITTNKKEHRVQRLQTPTADDNRITFGCINVGTSFYTTQVRPLFQKTGGIVYILPDTKTLEDVFPRVRLLPYMKTDEPEAAATSD